MPPPECLRKFLCCLANDDDAPSQSLLSAQHTESAAVAPPLIAETPPDGVETPASAAGEPSCAHLEMDDAMSRPPADGPIEDWTVSAARGAEPRRVEPPPRSPSPAAEAAASTPPPPPAVDAADVFLSASPTIDSVEAYMRRVGAAADEASELDLRGLNTETCAICCAEIILGPQHAIAEMSIPPGERPAHFECGHALHADCFAIYCASGGGRSCPICALDAADAGGGRDGDESGDDAGGRSDARFDGTRHRSWVGERSGPDDGGEGEEGGYDDGYGYDDEGEEDAEEHREGESVHRYSRSRRQHQEEELERREELELLAALQMSMDEYSRSPRGGGEEGADEPAGEGEAALPASRAPP